MKNKTESLVDQEKIRDRLQEIIKNCSSKLLIEIDPSADPSNEPLFDYLVKILEDCSAENLNSTKSAVDLMVNALELIWPSIVDKAKTGATPIEIAEYFTNQCARVIYEQAGITVPSTRTPSLINPVNTPSYKTSSTTSKSIPEHSEETKTSYPINRNRSASIRVIKENCRLDINQILSIVGLSVKSLLSFNELESIDAQNEATDKLSDYLLKQMNIDIDDLEVPLTEQMYQQLFQPEQSESNASTPDTRIENLQPIKAVLKAYQCSLNDLLHMMHINSEYLLALNSWSEEQILEFILAYTSEQTHNKTLSFEEFLERNGFMEKLFVTVPTNYTAAQNVSMKEQSSETAGKVRHANVPLNNASLTTQETQQPHQYPKHQDIMRPLQQVLQEQQTNLDELLDKNHLDIEALLMQNHWSEEQINSLNEQFACEFSLDENLTYEAFLKKHNILEKLTIKSSILETSKLQDNQKDPIKSAESTPSTDIVSYSTQELKKILNKDFNEILALLNLTLDDILKHNNIHLPENLDDTNYDDFKSLSAETQLSFLYEVDPDKCMIPVPTSSLSLISSQAQAQPRKQASTGITTIECRPLNKTDAPHIAGDYLYSFLASAPNANNQKEPCGMLIGKANARKLEEITAIDISLFITNPNYEPRRIEIFKQLLQKLNTIKEGLPNLQKITWYVTAKAEQIPFSCDFINNQTIADRKGTIQHLIGSISEKNELNIIHYPGAVKRPSTTPPTSTKFRFFDANHAAESKTPMNNTKPKPGTR